MLPNNEFAGGEVKVARVTLSANDYQAIQGQKISGKSEHVNDLAYLFFKYTPDMLDIAYIAVQIGVALHPHNKPTNPAIIMQSYEINRMIKKEKSRLAEIEEAVNPLLGRVYFCQKTPVIGKVNDSDETVRKKNAWMITGMQQQFICFTETDAIKVQQNLQQWLNENHPSLFTQTPYRLFDKPILGHPSRPLCRIPIDDSIPEVCRRIFTTLHEDFQQHHKDMLTAIKEDELWCQHILTLYKTKYGKEIKRDDLDKIDIIDLLPLYQSAGQLAVAANDNNYFQRLVFIFLQMNQHIVTLGNNLVDNVKRIKNHDIQFQKLSHDFNESLSKAAHPELKSHLTRYMNDVLSSFENECMRNQLRLEEFMVKRNEFMSALCSIELNMIAEVSQLPEKDNVSLFGNSYDYKKIQAYLDKNTVTLTSAASAAAMPEVLTSSSSSMSRRQPS